MNRIKTFELFGYEHGNLPGVNKIYTSELKKKPKFEIRRDKSGYWNLYNNGKLYGGKRIDIDEEEIDNQIRYVKDVLKIQRKIKSQDIIVDKDINGGIVKFIINQ